MSYASVGFDPNEPCQDDFDCPSGQLCCQSYCRAGADIDEYCGEMIDLPGTTVTATPPGSTPGSTPVTPPPKPTPAVDEPSVLPTVAVLAVGAAAVGWLWARG